MRWVVRLLGGIVVLVLLLVGGLALVPAEKIAAFATREISLRTGREVAFTGEVRPVFYPVLGVRTGPLQIGNAIWADKEPMLKADSLLIGVELMPLLSGKVKVKEFRLVNPDIRLEVAADGRANWQLAAPAPEVQATSDTAATTLPDLSLQDGQITNGRIRYFDHKAGSTTTLAGLDLQLSLPDLAGPLRASGGVVYNDQPVRFSLDLAAFQAVLDGKLIDLSLGLDGGFGKLAYEGAVSQSPPTAQGDLTAQLSDLSALGRLLGQGPDMAAGLAKTAGFVGKLTYTADGVIYLREAALDVDRNRLVLEADLKLGDIPFLTARINAGDLNLAHLTKSSGGDTAAGAGGKDDGWPKTPLDFSALKLVNADIAISAEGMDLGVVRLGKSQLRMQLDNGRLVTALNEVNAYQGQIKGELVLNARKGLSAGGFITGSDIQLQPLLIDLAEYDRLIAGASISLKFLTSGQSVDAMMRGLEGSGRIDIGGGEILGLDLAGMLRNLDASYRGDGSKTIFKTITGSYQIDKGILRNEDLKFTSDLVVATGKGDVDIGERTIAYRIVPVAFSDQNGDQAGGITVPVRIDGPWSSPRFTPDLQSLIDAELDKKREEVEALVQSEIDKAKADAEQRLQEELDKAVEGAVNDIFKQLTGE